MARALVGLGANLGDRRHTLEQALARLAAVADTRLLAHSQWLATAPVGGPSGQGEFLNGAALLETSLAAAALHAALHATEAALGRRRGQRWEARVLDLDLLLYDDLVVHSPELELPHPGLAYRRFVLEPAAEIAPDWRHPAIGWTLGRLLENLNCAANYVAIAGPEAPRRAELAAQLAAATGARLLRLQDCGPMAPAISEPAGDSPVQNAASGIEFLTCIRSQLTRAVADNRGWLISDFWCGDIPAWLGSFRSAEVQDLIAAWQAATPQVPAAKLVISLGGPLAAGLGPWLAINPATAPHDALAEAVAAMEAMR